MQTEFGSIDPLSTSWDGLGNTVVSLSLKALNNVSVKSPSQEVSLDGTFYYTCNLIIHYGPIQISYIVGSMFVDHLGLENFSIS